AREWMQLSAVKGIGKAASMSTVIKGILTGLNQVIFVLIGVASALALVVIYNLTNINVSERIRELSTIKVLGFYPREVTLYIYRETFILTIMGILVGYAAGIWLHHFIIQNLPPSLVMFSQTIWWQTYALA